MNTPTPMTETDLFEATKVSLEYGNQRLFKKSQSTRIVGEVAFSDGYEYALKHSSKIKQLERELTAAREELADWHNAAEQVKAEYPDEVHCSCVAILRKQLKHVTEQRDEAREVAARWESSSDAMVRAGAEQARRADENREWALKAIRERDEAREQRDRLAEACSPSFDTTETDAAWSAHCIDPDSASGDPWDLAKKLESELATVTEQRDGLRSGIDYASDQLTRVTEQRDEMARAIIRFNSGTCCLPYLVDLALRSLNQTTP